MEKEAVGQEILYRVKTKRDVGMMKAFLTFVNRVAHPQVSFNFIFFGLLVLGLPLTIREGHPVIEQACYTIGLFMILMGMFRHYIPLSVMKKKDTDYLEGVVTTYEFGKRDVKVFRNDELQMNAGSYQKIKNFYSDEYYYYLGMNEDDLFVLPKSCFEIGDADAFQAYIEERANVSCRWIPVKPVNKFKQFLVRAKINLTNMDVQARQRQQELREKEQEKKNRKRNKKKK